MSSAVVLTYHSISSGPPPLCIDPELFRRHLDCIAESGAHTLTVCQLADALREDRLPELAVAVTFDDGYRDVATGAAPALAERGIPATVYCVAGHIARTSSWPTLPSHAPRLPLASARELRELAEAGFEIGSHGMEHSPLPEAGPEALRRELVDSRGALERDLGVPVRSFAYPYGLPPPPEGMVLLAREYDAACGGRLRAVGAGTHHLSLPRVDAHYLRRPAVLRRVIGGSGRPYLAVRRAGARARRLVRKDFALPRGTYQST